MIVDRLHRRLHFGFREARMHIGPRTNGSFDAASLHPLLRYASSAGAQYLTGQTLDCAGASRVRSTS